MTNARATKIDKLSNTNCRERIETEQVEDGRGESSQARAEKTTAEMRKGRRQRNTNGRQHLPQK